MAKFIIEDCDAALAIPDLPWRSTEPYRVTKALVEASKIKNDPFAASPLNNDGRIIGMRLIKSTNFIG